jgi:acylphosphatase
MADKQLHCLVSGKVQGVWYRGSTMEQAQRLGLVGYARNLPDGRVEVVACGDETALQKLEKWLWSGPANAEVREVDAQWQNEMETFPEFLIRD